MMSCVRWVGQPNRGQSLHALLVLCCSRSTGGSRSCGGWPCVRNGSGPSERNTHAFWPASPPPKSPLLQLAKQAWTHVLVEAGLCAPGSAVPWPPVTPSLLNIRLACAAPPTAHPHPSPTNLRCGTTSLLLGPAAKACGSRARSVHPRSPCLSCSAPRSSCLPHGRPRRRRVPLWASSCGTWARSAARESQEPGSRVRVLGWPGMALHGMVASCLFVSVRPRPLLHAISALCAPARCGALLVVCRAQSSASAMPPTGSTIRPSSGRPRTLRRVSETGRGAVHGMHLPLSGRWHHLALRPHSCPPAVLDDSASMLLLTDVWRGMAYTLGAFFDKKVTVRPLVDTEAAQQGPYTRTAGDSSCVSCLSVQQHADRPAPGAPASEHRSCTPLRRASSARASAASTCSGGTRRARSGASPASCARR